MKRRRILNGHKVLALLCLIFLITATSGCKKWVTVSMNNHFRFPVDIYDADSSPNYPPQRLGMLAPNALSTFQIQEVPEGGNYHFILYNQQGKVLKDIVMLSTTLNKDGKPLILAPDPKPAHRKIQFQS